MIKPIAFAPIAVAVVLLLSACDPSGGGGSTTTPTADPTDSESPTPVVTKTADPAVKLAVNDLILSPEGLGPLVIGSPPPATDASLDIAILDPDYCAAYAADYGVPAGKWIPNYEPALSSEDGGDPFALLVQDGVLAGLDVRSAQPHTAAGIHVGSSLADLTAAYPGGFDTMYNHADISDVYAVDGTHGRILFEVPKDTGDDYWLPSDLGTVLFIHVTELSQPVFGVAGSDAGYGGCVSA